jgi:hypothetical protein
VFYSPGVRDRPGARGILICPLHIGGTAPNSRLTLQSTSGVGTSDIILFKTGSQVEAMRIDTSASVIIGGTASTSVGGSRSGALQVHGTSDNTADVQGGRWSNDINPFRLDFGKSRAGIGVQTAVQNNDGIFRLNGFGSDGTAFQNAVEIDIFVDGTPAAGIVPGRLVFATANASGTMLERMRIDTGGFITQGGFANTLVDSTNCLYQIVSSATPLAFCQITASADALVAGSGFAKTRGTTPTSQVIVQSQDNLGAMRFYGSDGVAFQRAARIGADSDGTPGANSMPGRLTFGTTPSGSVTVLERLRIDSVGQVGIGLTPSGAWLNIAAGTAVEAPLLLTSGTNLTTATAGAFEYDGVVHYSTHSANERGVLDSEQFISTQGGTRTLTSQTAAQKIFATPTNGQVTLKASTTYQFECWLSLSSMSATSGSFGFALGGTATITFANWLSHSDKAALATAAAPQSTYNNNSVANTTICTATTNTIAWAYIRGTVRINAAGTLIPQVSLGIAAAAVVGQDSWFRIWPLGTNTVADVGNWS